MAIEALKLELLENGTDNVIEHSSYFGGDQPIIDFLTETQIMLLVPHNGLRIGVLIQNPENVSTMRYFGRDDLVGEDVTGPHLIILDSECELFITSEAGNREVWIVNEPSENSSFIEPPQMDIRV